MGSKWDGAPIPIFARKYFFSGEGEAHFWLIGHFNTQNQVIIISNPVLRRRYIIINSLFGVFLGQRESLVRSLQSRGNAIEPRLMTFSCLSWRMVTWTTISFSFNGTTSIYLGNFWWAHYIASRNCGASSKIVRFNSVKPFFLFLLR